MPEQMQDLAERLAELERAFKELEGRWDNYGNGVTLKVNGLEQRIEENASVQEAQHGLQEWSVKFQQWTESYINICLTRLNAVEESVKALQPASKNGNEAQREEGATPEAAPSAPETGLDATYPEAPAPPDRYGELLARIEALESRLAERTEGASASPAYAIEASTLIPVELVAERDEIETLPDSIQSQGETGHNPADLTAVEETGVSESEPDTVETLPPTLLPSPPPAPVALDRIRLAEEALAREAAEKAEDIASVDASHIELEHWSGLCRRLQTGIAAAQVGAGSILAAATEAKEALPLPIQQRLEGRQRGLELIGKMLSRLLEKPTLEAPDTAPPPLPTLALEEWETLLAAETDEASARKRIEGQLRRLGTERFRIVAEYRALADGTRKRFKEFLTRQAFPVLDGIDDGERHSAELQAQFVEVDPEIHDILIRWMEAYPALRALLLETLRQVGVAPMELTVGEEVDYERHEPFDTEPDPGLPNEHIKSLVRNGYEYRQDGEELLLRSAQVIVVKN